MAVFVSFANLAFQISKSQVEDLLARAVGPVAITG